MDVWSILLFIIILFSLACVDIWEYPQSTTISLGDQDTLYCEGIGSYLYWYIDGVNTEDMTSETLQERGMQFDGYYNYYPPYYYGCDWQFSYMTITGNCLNNNTEIYCVILGSDPPSLGGGNATSPIANITVSGNTSITYITTSLISPGAPPSINSVIITIVQDSLSISWDITVPHNNYTLTLNVSDTVTNVTDYTEYYTMGTCGPVTLNLKLNNVSCYDTKTVYIYPG